MMRINVALDVANMDLLRAEVETAAGVGVSFTLWHGKGEVICEVPDDLAAAKVQAIRAALRNHDGSKLTTQQQQDAAALQRARALFAQLGGVLDAESLPPQLQLVGRHIELIERLLWQMLKRELT